MKRMAAVVFLVLWCLTVQSFAIAPNDISAKSAVVYDGLTGKVLFEKNSKAHMPIASTTKIMTAYTSLKIYELDRKYAIHPSWTGIEGSSMYLKTGEELSVEELLYGLMLMSGNDAAVALSSCLTGNGEDFVALMNRYAAQLGLNDTHFENPNGLDEGDHHSTAYDMARLTAEAMRLPEFRKIVGTANISIAGRYMKNHNRLLGMYPGICGVKTGFTKKAGRCLVSAAESMGRQVIVVTLSAPDDWNDHIKLYDKYIGVLEEADILPTGEIGSARIVSGERGNCPLYVNSGFSVGIMPEEGERIKISLEGPRMVYAPVCAGDLYGKVVITLDDVEIASREVYYKQDIAELGGAENMGFFGLLKRIFRK